MTVSGVENFPGELVGLRADNARLRRLLRLSEEQARVAVNDQATLVRDHAGRWSWNPIAYQWEEKFGQLQKYAEDNGHARVPQSHEVLGSWVGVQRGLRAKGKLNPGYEDRLSNVKGWSWDPKTEQWEEAFRQLIEFAENHHHTRVPPAGPLGRWIIRQRQAYDQDKLDADRKDRLNELKAKGWWSWDPYADQWEEGFGYLIILGQRRDRVVKPVPLPSIPAGCRRDPR